MARIHRNGNTIFRVSDISVVIIPNNEPTTVVICTRAGGHIEFRCKTEEEALNYLDTLQKLMEEK